MLFISWPEHNLCFRISHAGINLRRIHSDAISFNETAVDYIELIGKLQKRNSVVNTTVLELLKNFPPTARKLREISEERKIPKSEVVTDSAIGPVTDESVLLWMKEFSKNISYLLPITYSLLNPHNISRRDPFPMKTKKHYPQGSRPSPKELSWSSIINHHQLIMHDNDRECYFNWSCRIKRAANILEEIFNMNLAEYYKRSQQTASDFILR